ncbi:MAG: hypothetical protein ACLUEK_02965 [Oscillospiraceae bacterium]
MKITTSIPESGWSTTKDSLVENEDPDAFGAGEILFKVRSAVADFDSSKDLQELSGDRGQGHRRHNPSMAAPMST